MATAVSFKSESGDNYLFVMEDNQYTDLTGFVEELKCQWWADELLHLVGVHSSIYKEEEVSWAVGNFLQEVWDRGE